MIGGRSQNLKIENFGEYMFPQLWKCELFNMKLWSFEVRIFEIMNHWKFEILKLWHFETLMRWNFETLNSWSFSLNDSLINRLSMADYWLTICNIPWFMNADVFWNSPSFIRGFLISFQTRVGLFIKGGNGCSSNLGWHCFFELSGLAFSKIICFIVS